MKGKPTFLESGGFLWVRGPNGIEVGVPCRRTEVQRVIDEIREGIRQLGQQITSQAARIDIMYRQVGLEP